MTTMFRSWLAAALMLAVAPGQAQTLYKCVARGAPPSYQTTPCTPGTRIAASRDFQPEPPPTAAQLRQLELRRLQSQRDSEFLARRAGTDRQRVTARATRARRTPSVAPAADTCADARLRRDAWEQAAGLRRTFEDLRAWNDRVREACR